MNKKLIIFAATIFAIPQLALAQPKNTDRTEVREKVKAHREQQKQENQDFRKSLNNLEPGERISSIKEHMGEKYQEKINFQKTLHQEKMTKLRDQLSQNEKLTEAQKNEIIDFHDNQYNNNMKFHEQHYSENLNFIDELDKTPKENHKELSQLHRNEIKAENMEHRKQQKLEREKFRQSIKNDVQDKK